MNSSLTEGFLHGDNEVLVLEEGLEKNLCITIEEKEHRDADVIRAVTGHGEHGTIVDRR